MSHWRLAVFVLFCCCFFETGSASLAQADFELKILLPQPPECWNFRHVPLCPAYGFLLLGIVTMFLAPPSSGFW
jgi:hypothetical protein